MIPLAILCAALVAVVALGVRRARKRIAGLQKEIAASLESTIKYQNDWIEIQSMMDRRIKSDSAIISEAYALLHDKRHKGREENQKAWQAARDEWSAKVKGAKA